MVSFRGCVISVAAVSTTQVSSVAKTAIDNMQMNGCGCVPKNKNRQRLDLKLGYSLPTHNQIKVD